MGSSGTGFVKRFLPINTLRRKKMNTEFVELPKILETGIDLVSPHLRWLLRHAIINHCSDKAIDLIAYHKDIPKDKEGEEIWGESWSPAKAIAINLEKHFHSSIDQIQDESKMNTSLRCVLIRELLDTSIHEAHHLKASYKTGDFNNSLLEEKEAAEEGWNKSWMAAKYWDAEITVFGPLLDDLLEDFFKTLEEDTKEKPVMWKDLQVYMWKNQLAFYDPDKDRECKIREAFEAMAKDHSPWIDDPKQFLATVIQTGNTASVENIPTEPLPPLTQVTPQPEPFVSYEQYIPPEQCVPHSNNEHQEYYQRSTDTYNPQQYTEPYTEPYKGVIPPPPPTAPPATAVPTPPATINVLQMQQAIEAVLRTLFAHVMTKCGITQDGKFNNPNAVLEAVSIVHIPHALEIFSHMDFYDTKGIYSGNQPCNGIIKGLISKQGLPMYRFYLKIGDFLYKRIFITQNPDKLNANGELTAWAKSARNGAKIMMLLEDNAPPKAHLKLEPGIALGQEEFKIWEAKQEDK